jgi:hypothetical protein
VKENFPPKHSAKESFVEIPKNCNHMNQTTFVGKKSYGSKSYKNPMHFLQIKQTLKELQDSLHHANDIFIPLCLG